MHLQNQLPHKKNTAVCVNGHIYKIAHDRVIRDDAGNPVDVPPDDAKELLANAEAWSVMGATPAKPGHAEAKAGLKVLMPDGSAVTPPVRADDATRPAQEVSAVMAAQDAFEAKKQADAPAPKDPPIPKAGEDWADPLPEYSMAWLQACAKAYKVKIPKSKDKAALIEKIKAAMYE